MLRRLHTGIFFALALFMGAATELYAQQVGPDEAIHRRGLLWEDVWNYGMIGNEGAWDYLTPAPLGLYPGFPNFVHPFGSEEDAINTFVNANMHNFRSGVWVVAAGLDVPGTPPSFQPVPTDFEFFAAGASGSPRGIENQRAPIEYRSNFIEEDGFEPLLPEEVITATWHTNTGVTVTRRSYAWSFPEYDDFIIYDYMFENTGQIVSLLQGTVVPNPEEFQQTLEEVWFAFHSGVSVSTKSQINFHSDLTAVQAGAFGWQPPYHDFYHIRDEEGQEAGPDDGVLFFSTNYNGGAGPTPWDPEPLKDDEGWTARFGDELQSPAAFGWLALYEEDPSGTGTINPVPDVLRIDTHKGNEWPEDLEFFKTNERSAQEFHRYVTSPTLQEQLGNTGDRFNFYTLSYGPYMMAPGDRVRIVVAEIAGVMDYGEVIAGDPDGHFPDSTIAAITRNARSATDVVRWGIGAEVDGVPVGADAPEPPPSPTANAVNASVGLEDAAIAVTWTDDAETATIRDGAGTFYSGLDDLDGYRVYRSTDFQFANDVVDPVFRGAAWDLIADIPKSEFGQYWDAELGRYRLQDDEVQFGFRYGYYVSAYDSDPGTWTSANGTVVNDLPELESGVTLGENGSRTAATSAVAGPVTNFDVYVVPNPFVYGDPDRWFGLNDPYRIEFRNLPERAVVRIYTISGDLIRTLRHGPDAAGNLSGTLRWDQKSDSGLRVAPGLYVYHVDSDTEGLDREIVGKLMIVR